MDVIINFASVKASHSNECLTERNIWNPMGEGRTHRLSSGFLFYDLSLSMVAPDRVSAPRQGYYLSDDCSGAIPLTRHKNIVGCINHELDSKGEGADLKTNNADDD